MKKMFIALLILLALIGVAAYFLPNILQAVGLHPKYTYNAYSLPGKKALLIGTNQNMLTESKKPTGVYASEITVPYYEFLDAGMQVDIASIHGGNIPMDPLSLKWPLRTYADDRYLTDATFQEKLAHSLPIGNIPFGEYDIIFFAGGWGAAYDLGFSHLLGEKVMEADKANAILGGVCHGPLGFILAKKQDGTPFVAGRHITAVTDKQVRELGITETPQHPEAELRKLGALYESKSAFRDIFANHIVEDSNLITGQNQNAGGEVAQKMMQRLMEKDNVNTNR